MGAQEASSFAMHPLVSLVSACFWVILWLLSWVKALVAFVTIYVPIYIYAILSYSMTLTLNFWFFFVLFVSSAIAVNYWIRFRYLNDYTNLKEPPLVKVEAIELHPDVNSTDPPPTFHNYLDDFLQAIRVFGFLEKPVFHELARHLQTKRLIAGDSMALDQDKNFYCVVDGTVQVFEHTGLSPRGDTHWGEEETNGYQILNEVGSGGTLSSLFTILSLFTEDVKMSYQSREPSSDELFPHDGILVPFRRKLADLDARRESGRLRRTSVSSSTSTILPVPERLGTNGDGEYDDCTTPPGLPPPLKPVVPPPQIFHGVLARATEDTTLAVIPAEAFRRLTKKFPKATGHIVQVILTRFSRVTFYAAHKYLGLTTEVLRTEKAINDIACNPLPASFYEGGGLLSLRQRFDRGNSRSETAEPGEDYFSAASTTPLSPAKTPGPSILSDQKLTGSPAPVSHTPLAFRVQNSRYLVHAGDLHTTSHSSETYRPAKRTTSHVNTPRVPRPGAKADRGFGTSDHLSGDDFDLKEEVMSCIAKSIGLIQPPISGTDSIEASPAFTPTGEGGMFDSSYRSLSLLDLGDDASSVTGSVISTGGYLSGLDNEVEILFFPAGSTLAKAGERNTGLFYVIDGFLDILLPAAPSTGNEKEGDEKMTSSKKDRANPETGKRQSQKLLFTVKPGGIAGYLASLCSTASYVDIKAKTDTYVGFLPTPALERILEKSPIVLLTLAKRLISMLSPLVLHIDASLDWMHVNAGQVLWRTEDASDSFYVVINGRLRAFSEKEGGGGITILGEYGQGDTIGELDVITSSPRASTVHAIRDTELIRMPQTLFNAISARNPQTTAQLLRMIASRVRDEVGTKTGSQAKASTFEHGHNNMNLKTVAVLPVSRNIPIDAFARKLHVALESIGASTFYLNQAAVSAHLGKHAFTKIGKLKSAGWLADQEQRYHTVLYVADSPVNSPWTQTCIRQADCVMLVGIGDDPSSGEFERLLLSMKTTARKELVLLHPDRSVTPGSTREWLKTRPWVQQHIHVELPGMVTPISKAMPSEPDPGAVAALKNFKDQVQIGIRKFRKTATDSRPRRPVHSNDFARLARRICGKSIGVVLGGGGARGISHLGVLRALEEHSIPIDHIAGTSIGAFIGGLYAREGDVLSSAGRAKHFSSRVANIWRILSDVTYPIVAYTTGHEFNRAIYKALHDLHIEDMWLPYFCNTTNINTSQMEIHETGYAWRFIRASMTLVGLLPPLCSNGCMLVDGGYIDNLPVASMFSMGASAVFASDVGSIDDNSPRSFGDSVSGWWLFINRWNPFSNAKNIPAITEIQSRLAYVSSVNTLELAKVAKGCLYMQIPVQEYSIMQFGKFEEIQKVGYHAAMKILRNWEDGGRLPSPFVDGVDISSMGKRKGRSARRNSI